MEEKRELMALFDEKDGGGVGGGAADSDSGIETPVMKFIFFWTYHRLLLGTS